MPPSTRPLMALYVAWHPSFAEGHAIAKVLFDHYRREPYRNVAGGLGLSVLYRYQPLPGSTLPAAIDLSEAETTAVVMLIDDAWMADADWVRWAKEVLDEANRTGLRARVFPVAIQRSALDLRMREQAIRWDEWTPDPDGRREHVLITTLTYQLCRMMRTYLVQLDHPLDEEATLEHYLQKVQVFLSHSKHDTEGVRIARHVRERLFQKHDLGSFFDVHDIPAGLAFDRVILHAVRVSAVVALHTDSYSSREWCRREIIEAKRWHVPLVVANCINDLDMRGFPYLGNVPIVRLLPETDDRIDQLIGYLLDEVLKDFLWRCRVKLTGATPADVVFLPRPPELVSLAGLDDPPGTRALLVYPDPPLGAEEQRLFEVVAPSVKLRSMTEWIAGVTP